jgi:hypothetical protein
VSGIYETFTNLQNLALISSICVGFGTLAVVPTINIIRKHKQTIKIEIERQNILKMRALIKEEIEDLTNKIDTLDSMIRDLVTDIRVLEALDNQDHNRDTDQQKERSYNNYKDIKRNIKRQGKD